MGERANAAFMAEIVICSTESFVQYHLMALLIIAKALRIRQDFSKGLSLANAGKAG